MSEKTKCDIGHLGLFEYQIRHVFWFTLRGLIALAGRWGKYTANALATAVIILYLNAFTLVSRNEPQMCFPIKF